MAYSLWKLHIQYFRQLEYCKKIHYFGIKVQNSNQIIIQNAYKGFLIL